MNYKTSVLAVVLTVVMTITGCVTIEDQLNSPDPSTRLVGEHRLLTQARQSGKAEEVLNAVKRIQTKPLLLEISKNASQKSIEEGQLALSKLTDEKDFATLACLAVSPQIRRMAFARVSQQETLLAVCTRARDSGIRKSAMDKLSPESLSQLPYSPDLFPYWKKITDQKTLAKIYRDTCGVLSKDDMKSIADKIEDEAILEEMVIPMPGHQLAMVQRNRKNEKSKLSCTIRELRDKAEYMNSVADHAKKNWNLREEKRARREAVEILTQVAQMQKNLDLIDCSPVTGLYITNDTDRTALYGRIKNADVFERIVSATDEYNRPLFKTREELAPILKRMPEGKALKFVLGKLNGYNTSDWNDNKFWPLELAAGLAVVAKDSKSRVRLADAAIGKIESIKDTCQSSLNFRLHWSNREESAAAKYAADFPLSEDEKFEILCTEGLARRRVVEIADEDTARRALSSGRTLNEKIEKMLVAKIPGERIDLALYESVKSEIAKDALYKKMPDSVRESINAASATQEATALNKPSVKVSVGDVNIATINMDDVVAAIKTWQKERWEADKIVAIRKSKGRVAVDDLKLSANYKGIQPLLDIMIADYIICVNVLDSFVDAQTPKDAVAMLLKSLSMDDILKMAKNCASAVDSAKSIKDNVGWRDVIPIGKDMVTIYAVSSSMINASGILKGIFDKLMSK